MKLTEILSFRMATMISCFMAMANSHAQVSIPPTTIAPGGVVQTTGGKIIYGTMDATHNGPPVWSHPMFVPNTAPPTATSSSHSSDPAYDAAVQRLKNQEHLWNQQHQIQQNGQQLNQQMQNTAKQIADAISEALANRPNNTPVDPSVAIATPDQYPTPSDTQIRVEEMRDAGLIPSSGNTANNDLTELLSGSSPPASGDTDGSAKRSLSEEVSDLFAGSKVAEDFKKLKELKSTVSELGEALKDSVDGKIAGMTKSVDELGKYVKKQLPSGTDAYFEAAKMGVDEDYDAAKEKTDSFLPKMQSDTKETIGNMSPPEVKAVVKSQDLLDLLLK